MATKYAVGALWNDTNNWSASSGGAGGAGVPTSGDDLIFDANSVSMAIDVNAVCGTLVTTSGSGDFAGTLTQNSTRTFRCYGTVNWSAGTLTLGDSEWRVDGTFTVSGGTVTAGTGSWDLNGDFTVSGGSVTGGSGTWFVENVISFSAGSVTGPSGILQTGDHVTMANGVYAHNNGTFKTTSSDAQIINVGNNSLYKWNIANTHTSFTITGTALVLNECTWEGGAACSIGTLELQGNLILKNTTLRTTGTATVKFSGSGTQTVLPETAGTTRYLYCGTIDIDKTGGTVTFGAAGDTIRVSVDFWTQTSSSAHTVIAGAIYFGGADALAVTPGTVEFQDVYVTMGSYQLAVTGTWTVKGDFHFLGGARTNAGNIELYGDYITYSSTVANSEVMGILKFVGSNNQRLIQETVGATRTITLEIEVNKTGGNLVIGDPTGILQMYGDTFTYTAGTALVAGPVQFRGGWVHTYVDALGSVAWQDLLIACGGSSDFDITGILKVVGQLWIDSVDEIDGGYLDAYGDIVVAEPDSANGSTVLRIKGTYDQTIMGNGGAGAINACVDINKVGGTLYINNAITIGGATFTHTAGTVSCVAGSVLIFDGESGLTITPGTMQFASVSFTVGSYNITIAGAALVVNGDLAFYSAVEIAGAIELKGNLASTDSSIAGTCTITLNGTGTQNISCGGYDVPNGLFTINKASGSAVLNGNFSANGTGQDLTVTAGTLDLAGYNLVVNDVLTVASGATLRLKGNGTVTAATKTLASGCTVEYYDSAVTAVLSNLGVTGFSNLTLGASKAHNFAAGTTYTVSGTLKSNGYSTTQAVLASTTPTTYWNLNLSGTSILDGGANITDCNASSGSEVSAVGSTDGGHNLNIDFGAAGGTGGCGVLKSAIIQGV